MKRIRIAGNVKTSLVISFLLVLGLSIWIPYAKNSQRTYPELKIEQKVTSDIPQISTDSDGKTYYESNWYTFREQFNDYDDYKADWVNVTFQNYASIATIDNGRLKFTGGTEKIGNTIYMYSATVTFRIPPEKMGDIISFDYQATDSNSVLRLQVYSSAIEWWVDPWIIPDTSGTANVDVSAYKDNNPGFNFRFIFAWANPDYHAYIDNVQFNTYEFLWEEKEGDLVEPDQDQEISLFTLNNLTNFNTNNVSVRYNVNNPDLSAGSYSTSLSTQNNFSIIIPESAYESSDIVYYQICIQDGVTSTYQTSTLASFKIVDYSVPYITNIADNATTSENNTLITCYIADNENGVGLQNVEMRIANGVEPTKSDPLISSNRSGSIPIGGGYFGFFIPHTSLSAYESERLHFKIYATDLNSNEHNTGDMILDYTIPNDDEDEEDDTNNDDTKDDDNDETNDDDSKTNNDNIGSFLDIISFLEEYFFMIFTLGSVGIISTGVTITIVKKKHKAAQDKYLKRYADFESFDTSYQSKKDSSNRFDFEE